VPDASDTNGIALAPVRAFGAEAELPAQLEETGSVQNPQPR
jgi:hypothetical protein